MSWKWHESDVDDALTDGRPATLVHGTAAHEEETR
jgi:hypothetical protein